MPSYLHMCRPKPDTDCDPFVGPSLLTANYNTGKPGLAGTQLTPELRAPPVKLARMDVGTAGNVRDNRIRREGARHEVDLLRLTPTSAPLYTRKNHDLTQRIVLALVQTPLFASVPSSKRGITSAR